MPLTSKGRKILKNMEKEYGEKKGKQVLYASRNAGRITGIDRRREADDQAGRLARGDGVRGRDRAKLR